MREDVSWDFVDVRETGVSLCIVQQFAIGYFKSWIRGSILVHVFRTIPGITGLHTWARWRENRNEPFLG